MLNADQIKELFEALGLTTTITRNGIELDSVKAVVINGSLITQFPIKTGDTIAVHNKSYKVLSVSSIADDLYFQGTYGDYV